MHLTVALLIALLTNSAGAFDTFWHSAATSAATKSFGFTLDATNVVQFGNFSGPDFFGPVFDTILPSVAPYAATAGRISPAVAEALEIFYKYRQEQIDQLGFAVYMHFDNLHGDLDSNGKFDYLFRHLLVNTRQSIDWAFIDPGLNQGFRKMAVLMALGASLHMVQDFYSHSNWVHQDFEAAGVPLVKMPWGKDRAPTWFEVRNKLGDPDHWPQTIKIVSGIYPPVPGTNLTHTHMNHDNSQLVYKGTSQAGFHNGGPMPVGKYSAAEHQLFAANTAAGASMEWIRMVEEDFLARSAIEYAKTWDLKSYNAAMLHDLEGGLGSVLMLSCLHNNWDGAKPSEALRNQCRAMEAFALPSVAMGTEKAIPPMQALPVMSVPIPSPLNEFWAVHTKCTLMKRLTKDFAGENGHYNLGVQK
jgi:hypothetical protein